MLRMSKDIGKKKSSVRMRQKIEIGTNKREGKFMEGEGRNPENEILLHLPFDPRSISLILVE